MSTFATDPESVLAFAIGSAQDIFALRRSGQAAAEVLGLPRQDQVRLATALSELGRDRLGCDGLAVTFALHSEGPPSLVVVLAWDHGTRPGPESLELAARLVHRVRYEEGSPRSRVVIEQPVPMADTAPALRHTRLRDALHRTTPTTLVEDLRAQTRDLISTIEETRAQREELRRLNEELEETNKGVLALYTELSQELEETNSGVVALHAELEDKSRQLRETSEAKTRFWTNISHELRTPVNAVVALSRLLLAPDSPDLKDEQRQQVSLIASAGHTLLALVGDLLDVAKAESGQLHPHPAPVDLRTLFGQLGGLMRGTVHSEGVALVMPESGTLPVVVTDEVLLSRILRNLLSNALKFTEHGEVRLDFTTDGTPTPWLVFTVTDTGVGIPRGELKRIFEEFYQVRGPHQRGRPGTGLGLPYARTLAELLGGTLTLTSTPGVGTRVEVRLPDLPTPPAVERPDTADAPPAPSDAPADGTHR
ncbi:sensor histidine kinase [Streptomyces sp. DT24]|uniref:sensor histidine kinase n=1 Tax=unclassified Streptomyces TaxID=2593676 RepID=UPI0023B99E87|nr:sensor histidine kinase [Streptomyces sp. AM 4-1-1]WEH37477.1 sensor histidine kinase [Streptomyces sp. AM 4-1-1]